MKEKHYNAVYFIKSKKVIGAIRTFVLVENKITRDKK